MCHGMAKYGSKNSQTKKEKYLMISFICVIKRIIIEISKYTEAGNKIKVIRVQGKGKEEMRYRLENTG